MGMYSEAVLITSGDDASISNLNKYLKSGFTLKEFHPIDGGAVVVVQGYRSEDVKQNDQINRAAEVENQLEN